MCRCMTIYHLNKITGSLARKILPDATVIRANPAKDTAESVLAAVPKGETEFLYHFGVTYSILWPPFRSKLTAALQARGIQVYNHQANDLSRTTLQGHLAAAGLPTLTAARSGSAEEILLVRPNFNYFGGAQVKFHTKFPALFPRYPKTVKDFRIMPRREVPAPFWDDEDVQIERFVSNPDDVIYRVLAFKDRALAVKYINPKPIKKGDEATSKWRFFNTTRNPEILRVMQYARKVFKKMKYDFGALDVLADAGGQLYACDMNSTPFYGGSWHGFNKKSEGTNKQVFQYLRGEKNSFQPPEQ